MRHVRFNHMVNRLFYTKLGQIIISMLFGLSLSLMFHRVCKGDQCFRYVAPPEADVTNKTFRNGSSCFQYSYEIVPCKEESKAA